MANPPLSVSDAMGKRTVHVTSCAWHRMSVGLISFPLQPKTVASSQ